MLPVHRVRLKRSNPADPSPWARLVLPYRNREVDDREEWIRVDRRERVGSLLELLMLLAFIAIFVYG
jgi:hypothetical protein